MAVVTRLTPNTHDKSQCSQPERESERERGGEKQAKLDRTRHCNISSFQRGKGVGDGVEGRNCLILPGKNGIFKNLHSIIGLKYGLIVDSTLLWQ